MSRRLVSKRLPSSLRWVRVSGSRPVARREVAGEKLEGEARVEVGRVLPRRAGGPPGAWRTGTSLPSVSDAEGREAHRGERPRALVGEAGNPGVRGRDTRRARPGSALQNWRWANSSDVVAPHREAGQLDQLGPPRSPPSRGWRRSRGSGRRCTDGQGRAPPARAASRHASSPAARRFAASTGALRTEGEGEGENGRGIARGPAEETARSARSRVRSAQPRAPPPARRRRW